ncbi:SMI1/KNR4 family protein [Falsiroseomonas sp. HW251]|uniref:SMI1/KNR4 family protein n=1 Tax=Falsiroseomonas sp. HW251 TaxID=3390998 RepID=UPI003D3104CC
MIRRAILAMLAAIAAGLGWFALHNGGGSMPPIGPARADEASWRALLAELSALAIADPLIRPRLTPAQVEARWLGEPPATEEEIAAAEARLGIRLPGSYRGFLRVSNGWNHPSSFIGRVRPVQEIAPFVAENRDWAVVYADIGDDVSRHILATLQISRFDHDGGDDAVMLLAPAALSAAGEMEAWFFANWVPGAHVHPSFWHLMVAEVESLKYIAASRR